MTAVKKTQKEIVDNSEVSDVIASPTTQQQNSSDIELKWNRKILVVDDEPEIISIYSDILSENIPKDEIRSSRSRQMVLLPEPTGSAHRFQFEVSVASSYAEAMKCTQELDKNGGSFAVGFFDVRLGDGRDGIELAKEIQALFPDMYFVFVTAYNDRTIESISQVLGPERMDRWDYMNKPFNKSEITQKARNFVALWNLQKDKSRHADVLADLNRRVLESERVTAVAAVARGVAHEFGNLLMQIMGKAEVSRERGIDEMRSALDKIIDASQRANEILDRFNHLSDTKSTSSIKSQVTVSRIIDEALDLLGHQFKKSNTKINILNKASLLARVNSTAILQVLVNLFINALHAMGDGGTIDISLSDKQNSFELMVRDHGPGVPTELMDKVLEPFFTTKGDKGTGLGLAICREIIEIDHRGEFELKNHPDRGLVITMTVPK